MQPNQTHARGIKATIGRYVREIRLSHLAISAALLVAPVGSCTASHSSPSPDPTPSTTPAPGANQLTLRVSGKGFVDQAGNPLQLRGVNRPGMEYRCVQDVPYGFITDDNSIDGKSEAYIANVVGSLKTWDEPGDVEHAINTVRIPLNEACWLGINGAHSSYSGASYRSFVRSLVDAITDAGMYTILDLHWSAPGSFLPTQQDVGPNADHSIAFWMQVAEEFKDTPSVAFDLFNEPHIWCHTSVCSADYSKAVSVAWGCYRDGCTYTYGPKDYITGRSSGTIEIVGTQKLVDAIRFVGAENVIFVAGLGYANALDNWVNYKPNDPLNQLAASIHTYTSSGANVNNVPYLDGILANGGLSTTYPILVGEFGEWLCGTSTTGFTEKTMAWADQHGYSYTAWGWDRGEGCNGPSLVDNNGTGAPSTFGAIVRSHLRKVAR